MQKQHSLAAQGHDGHAHGYSQTPVSTHANKKTPGDPYPSPGARAFSPKHRKGKFVSMCSAEQCVKSESVFYSAQVCMCAQYQQPRNKDIRRVARELSLKNLQTSWEVVVVRASLFSQQTVALEQSIQPLKVESCHCSWQLPSVYVLSIAEKDEVRSVG